MTKKQRREYKQANQQRKAALLTFPRVHSEKWDFIQNGKYTKK